MYSLIRPILFQLDAEKAHALTLSALHWLPSRLFPKPPASQEINALGLRFPHPIGLAAGLDKNGEHLQALAKLGFAFIEIGTLTPRPQSGNPAPRLFRLPEAQAIINRMGFNNAGVEAAVQNIKSSHYSGLLGVNIGKNKDTPLQKAAEDYLFCLQKVYPHASYVTVNISSPNTPDLRQLQQSHYLKDLLAPLCEEQKRLADSHQRHVPLVVKLSPDENDETLKQIAETLLNLGIEGIIATNTTCSRDAVAHAANAQEQGGLSGPPLFERSTHCLRLLKQMTGTQMTLIGVGGINSKETAREKLAAGASLLQIYTGLIYEGPGLIRDLVF